MVIMKKGENLVGIDFRHHVLRRNIKGVVSQAIDVLIVDRQTAFICGLAVAFIFTGMKF